MACSAALAVALIGCAGSGGETETEVVGPRIESAVANELAGISEEIAARLESGDRCGAGESAAHLRERVTAAINEGEVPEVYLEDLSGMTNELEAQIPPCVVEPPPPSDDEEDGDEDRGRDKRDKKDKKDKHEEDD